MSTQVEASTFQAGQLFSTNRFKIPDFQREYSWRKNNEAADFWRDLRDNLLSPPYFLGLIIITDEGDTKTVVDGQQRIVTLSLLANSIRKAALLRDRRLVADSMRDVFLFALDYETEKRSPRVELTADQDRATLAWLLGGEEVPIAKNENMVQVQEFLDRELEADLKQYEPSRLGKWAQFISGGLTFALFEHPDRNAAYKVFEVVNTRGRDLTPAELIKSFVISNVSPSEQNDTYKRWITLEDAFREIGASSHFTQFIRHVITLRNGYVLPRDLYQVITSNYKSPTGISRLFSELEEQLTTYLEMVDPGLDVEQDDFAGRSFSILNALGLTTVRPIFLAVLTSRNAHDGLRELIRIIVPRVVSGTFGTGSVERKFADAAREIFVTRRWEDVIEGLSELLPSRQDFENGLTRPQSKGVLWVIRNSLLEETVLPSLWGHLHLIRPRLAKEWPGFSDSDFKQYGSTLGNSLLLEEEKRPSFTSTYQGVVDGLLPKAIDNEMVPKIDGMWDVGQVEALNHELARRSAELWYGN